MIVRHLFSVGGGGGYGILKKKKNERLVSEQAHVGLFVFPTSDVVQEEYYSTSELIFLVYG